MRYYIDLGSRKGVSLKWAIGRYTDMDKYIAFEPVPEFYNRLVYKFRSKPKVKINKAAIGAADKKDAIFYLDKTLLSNRKMFIGKGSSLVKGMQCGEKIKVKKVSLSNYILNNFKKSDYIIVKVDIEGMEYDVLEDMIASGAMSYINELFCEWHNKQLVKKTDATKEGLKDRQENLIDSIKRNGLHFKKHHARFGNYFIRKATKDV